jgi:UDPglucose 6-dehydrogenase
MKITVAGSGYVGLVTAACLSDTGNEVVAYDIDAKRVAALEAGECPIFEPGLQELIKINHAARRLRFTTDLELAATHGAVFFVAIGTPPGRDGAADLSHIEAFARAVAPRLTKPVIMVIKSTVPVGTGARVEALINATSKAPVRLVSNPEFLKEGSAISDFQKPDRVVIGAEDPEAAQIVRELYLPFVRNQRPILLMARAAAELTKYAANACLAARVSLINEIANVCDAYGVDVDDVRRGMGTDQRIGFQFLYPGAGYGGSCFPKDVQALAYVARQAGIEPRLLDAVHHVNEAQKRILFAKVKARLGVDLKRKVLALWGAAFKPNTDDIREAPALTLIDQLLESGAVVRLHDPEALSNVRACYGERLQYFTNNYEALDGADGLVICTEWNEFRSPDFDEIRRRLRHPIVFDGRNLYEPVTMRRHGLEYYPIGRPSVRP